MSKSDEQPEMPKGRRHQNFSFFHNKKEGERRRCRERGRERGETGKNGKRNQITAMVMVIITASRWD